MATRNSVETKIAAINDRGNNTAAEVRDVLTEVLNYTENQASLETFQVVSASPIESTTNDKKLFFSIKGIKGETANMTLVVKPIPNATPTDSNQVVFMVPFNQTTGSLTVENFNLLAGNDAEGILPLIDNQNFLIYTIPLYGNDPAQGTLVIALARNYGDYNNMMLLSISNFRTGVISTSISMHVQKFEESLIDNVTNGNINVAVGPRAKATKPTEKDIMVFFNQLFSKK
ncbi:hypothetical protein GOQ30_10765 [Flavobacterium sp. TP390]|uniref:Uncharacterized protein n=1 Tax=Flavobacterium profundi TaxID=1774945 RepID=A0A6I4IM32_9FLAO|nr:hypothetical protein [Flavobacterium profundi]MVO09642.1 hypothetical protein [Flavobacterium profundi]